MGALQPTAYFLTRSLIFCAAALLVAACEGDADDPDANPDGPLYSVASVVQDPEGRTLYLWAVDSLDKDLEIASATEIPGNSRHWSYEGAVYVGLAEEPTIVKLVPGEQGGLKEADKVSFAHTGLSGVPAGVAFLAPDKAYLFAESQYLVVIWNPTTMEITGSIDLSHLKKEQFSVEMHMASVGAERIYVPLRYFDWANQKYVAKAEVMIFDPSKDELAGIASSDRCVGAQRPFEQADGTTYLLADGRSYLVQAWAMDADQPVPHNCILRILPGATDFDADFFVDIPELTGGPDAATAFWRGGADGVAFAKLFHEDQLDPSADGSAFKIWSYPTFGLWRFELGDTVKATQVKGVPYSIVDFGGVAVEDQFYIGLTKDTSRSPVYRVDPATGEAKKAFEIDGQLREIFRLR